MAEPRSETTAPDATPDPARDAGAPAPGGPARRAPWSPTGPRADFLAQVCAEAVERVAADRAGQPTSALRVRVADMPAPPSFADALAVTGVAVITEVKRASPSRGHIADIPDAAALARAYVAGGAAAISVLTEPVHFGGSLADLEAVTAAVAVPALRKDFVVDAHQLWQARAAGAAAALLIVAALSDDDLVDLLAAADEAGLDTLVETHSAEEVRRAVAAHAAAGSPRRLVLGVNARDLVTLHVDREHIARVRAEVDLPDGALLVAESGIRGPEDVRAYAAVGADAVLVGEHVATATDPTTAVAELVAVGRLTRPEPASPTETGDPAAETSTADPALPTPAAPQERPR